MDKKTTVQEKIESAFRDQVQHDKKVKNAYLLVHSGKLDLDIRLAEGKTTGNLSYRYLQRSILCSKSVEIYADQSGKAFAES